MLGAGGVSGDEGQIDIGACHAGKLYLCLFCGFLQSLECHLVLAQVDIVFSLELLCDPVDNALVEVVAAQLVVAGGSKNLEHAVVADFKQGNIKCTAAQIVDHDLLVFVLVNAVSESCRSRLVDNTEHFKTCNFAGVLGSLTLCVGEVSGNGDDRLSYCGAQECFRVGLQLLKNHCGDLLRCVILAVNINAVA